MPEVIVKTSFTESKIRFLAHKKNIYFLEFKRELEDSSDEKQAFVFFKIFSSNRNFAATLQSICFRNYEISGKHVRILSNVLVYMPNIRSLRFFRRSSTKQLDPYLVPNLHQVLLRPSNTIQALALSKKMPTSRFIYSDKDLYLLSKMTSNLKYFFCFFLTFVEKEDILRSVTHFFLANVEATMRTTNLNLNFGGLRVDKKIQTETSFDYFIKVLGKGVFRNDHYWTKLNDIYRSNLYVEDKLA